MDLVGFCVIVPSHLRGQGIFFSWVFRESNFYSPGYFVGPKFFLAFISWVTRVMLGECSEP